MSSTHLPHATQPHPIPTTYQENDQPHKLVVALRHRRDVLFRLASGPIRFWYALRCVSGSSLGCIRNLLSRKSWSLLLGPWYEVLPTGCLVRNERSNARSVGIQELMSRYPWANTVELEMFLAGFDKGEQFALGRSGRPAQVVCESSVASHFQSCPNNPKRNLDIDMLKRQWYKSQYESPRLRNPSQSG
jgi:hypothetical protein